MFCKDTKEAINNIALIVAIRLNLLNKEGTEDPEWLKNLFFGFFFLQAKDTIEAPHHTSSRKCNFQ